MTKYCLFFLGFFSLCFAATQGQMQNNIQNFFLAVQSIDKLKIYSNNDTYSELLLDSLQTRGLISSYSMATVASGPTYLVIQLKESPICILNILNNPIEYKMEFFISTADSHYKEIMASVQSAVAGNNKVQILYPDPSQSNPLSGDIAKGEDVLNVCVFPNDNVRGKIMYCPIRRLTVFGE